jgi:hypothetical protein
MLPQVIPAGVLTTEPEPVPLFAIVRLTGWSAKAAVTLVAALIETTHEPVPAQPPPLQPAKAEPAAGLAVRDTLLPVGKAAAQLAPQAIPAGALVTVPAPAPVLLTVRVTGSGANVAVTLVAALNATTHAPVPEQPPPLHPEKAEPAAAAAVRVTLLPPGKVEEQVVPQLMPAGVLVTLPLPVPERLTLSETGCGVNVAVTLVAELNVTTHAPVPEQPPPLHPLNVEPAAGLAVRVTLLPPGKVEEQVAPQLMPAGELVTVPLPEPEAVTLSETG